MELKWDHIIHYVDGLAQFNFPDDRLILTDGGRHDTLGTYNKLSYFDLSYIEFIDMFDISLVEKAAASDIERLSFAATLARTNYQEGLKRLCFRTDDIMALKDHFISCGLDVIGPNTMSRTKPDGKVISWQLLYIDDQTTRELPFFIQWNQSDDERIQQLQQHFQPMTVKQITLVTHDKERLLSEWQSWFGAVKTGDTLRVAQSPLFRVIEGADEGIKDIIIKAQSDETMTVHNGTYIFQA